MLWFLRNIHKATQTVRKLKLLRFPEEQFVQVCGTPRRLDLHYLRSPGMWCLIAGLER